MAGRRRTGSARRGPCHRDRRTRAPLRNITGSTGRYEDFTRHFLPRSGDTRNKERWRNIYTLAETGKGFPPIDVYKIDQVYFVKDGNHRVSVERT
jgi:hypothetical protein